MCIFAVLMKERSIEDILKGFQKVELEDLGNILGSVLPHRMKKSEQVAKLTAYLTGKPRRWLAHLSERDIRLLKSLVHAGPGKVKYLDTAGYPSMLEVSGLVDSDDSDSRFRKVWVRREVYDIVAPHIDRVIKRGERTGQFEVERVGMGYLNLYGILPLERFIDLIAEYYEQAFLGDFDSLLKILNQSPLIKVYRYVDIHGDYLLSPCVSSADDLFQFREEIGFENEPFKTFTVEEAMEAGSGAPYFTVGLKTPEGKALTEALQRIGYDGFDLVKAQHEIWAEAQVPLGNDALFGPLTDRDESIGSDILYETCVHAVIDYANSVPKWALNGFSALEKDLMVLEYPSDEVPEGTDAEDETYPRWTMPRPTISDGYTDLIEKDEALERLSPLMPEGFPFGLAIPHVAPTDPCPCGSGLKYGHCHGKNLN